MDTIYSLQPLNAADADRIRGHLERVQREQTEWLEAQLHQRLHGFWDRTECVSCKLDEQIAKAKA